MHKTKKEVKIIFVALMVFFIGFLISPLIMLAIKSFQGEGIFTLNNYINIFKDKEILKAIPNSIIISLCAASIATGISFLLAYTINCTNLNKWVKRLINLGITLPMLLPTITYGFAIIYSFGKQGLLTKLFGGQLFEIYGFNGLLIGYVIYTVPATFLVINNSFKYIDQKFIVVSKLMGDSSLKTFINTSLRPLVGTIAGAFVLAFILAFTDFGIPVSVGGTYQVVAVKLYEVMLGAIPDFNGGAVIALMMLIPAIFGVWLLNYLERFNFQYDKITKIETIKNKGKDIVLGATSSVIIILILAIFAVMFITPFMNNFPYDTSFTLKYFKSALKANNMMDVYTNSLIVATFTAIVGTCIAYFSAIINTRTSMKKSRKTIIDAISTITNTVPGMVLGIAYLLLFKGSSLKGTFTLIIICNIVHFFTTPYLMAKNSLSKMNMAWETTAEIMGDTWIKTIYRVIIPNSLSTLVEMFSYYFINSMVTISAIIFLVGARTSVVTTKIKELQHFAKFNEIFVLSILIFVTNLVVKLSCQYLYNKKIKESKL